MEDNDEAELLTPSEKEFAAHMHRASGIEGRSYHRISLMGFVVVALLAFLINISAIIALSATIGTAGIVAWFALMAVVLMHTHRHVGRGRSGAGTAYLFILSCTVCIGALGGIASAFLGGAGIGSVVTGFVGAAEAFFVLEGRGVA